MSKMQQELAVTVCDYVNGAITPQAMHQRFSFIINDPANELSTNQRADILKDLNKKIGSTIVAEMLRYIL